MPRVPNPYNSIEKYIIGAFYIELEQYMIQLINKNNIISS